MDTAIETLRTFALTHNEIAFAHLCTAALTSGGWTHFGTFVEPVNGTLRYVAGGRVVDIRINDPRTTITRATVNADNLERIEGEEWAVDRVGAVLANVIIDPTSAINTAHALNLIRFTDTARPDGAIARAFEI